LVDPLVRWGFYGYVFSIPLEYPEREIPLEVHTITGSVFLLLALFQARVCFRSAPRALPWFAAFVVFYLVRACLTEHIETGLKLFGNVLQVFFLFWVSYNLLKDVRIARTALLVFVASCTVVVTLGKLGLTDAGNIAARGDVGRLTMFGQDPNFLASRLGLAIIVLAGMALGSYQLPLRYRLLAWPLLALLLATIEYTGSRGGYIALLAGFAVLCLSGASRIRKSSMVIIGLLLIGLSAAISYRSGNMWARMERSLEAGNLSGRERIYPEAWQMFLEQPLYGHGPGDHLYELESRLEDNHQYRDTHNILLDVLTSCGLMGAIPFFISIAICVRAGWQGRAGPAGIMPFAMVVTLLTMTMSINMSASKTLWLALAYAAAVGSCAARPASAIR
jgi:O-antigen ligase